MVKDNVTLKDVILWLRQLICIHGPFDDLGEPSVGGRWRCSRCKKEGRNPGGEYWF